MKPNLPEIPLLAPLQRDTETLRRWLAEREPQIDSGEKVSPVLSRRRPLIAVHSRYQEVVATYDKAPESIAPGCVRLLSSRILPEATRPIYVLVLAEWESEDRLVAVFSPYGEPATTTEYRTGREEVPLRVLSAWNACSLQTEDLEKGWLAARFSDTELKEAFAVFRNAISGEPIPAVLESRVGPPVFHPLDPRIEYQSEEAAILSGLLDTSLAAGNTGGTALVPQLVHAFPGSGARWREIAPAVKAASSATEIVSPGILLPGSLVQLEQLLASKSKLEPSQRFEARLLVAGSEEGGESASSQWDLEGTVAANAEGALAALVSPARNAVLALGEVEDATLFIDPPTFGRLSLEEQEECILVVFTEAEHE